MNATIREKLRFLPDKPGVYLMKDESNNIIYVGKAKVLKNRVRSYFTGSHDAKTQRLVMSIVDFEYIVTSTVVEALVLECNLIKHHTPQFNIQLRDDKTYPYIKLTTDDHPRIEIVRRVLKDKAKYFGPYPNAQSAQEARKLLDRLYPLRKCHPLRDKVCLYYHIGQCLAPCEFPVATETYQEISAKIVRFLSGQYDVVVDELKEKMQREADELHFERAKELRDLIAHIERIAQKQRVALPDGIDRDVFGYYADKGMMCIQIFYIRKGKLIERDVTIFNHYNEPSEDFFSYMAQFYFENNDLPKEIFVPNDIEGEWLEQWLAIRVIAPQRGEKRKLVDMATNNASIALMEKFQMMERDEKRTERAVAELGQVLGIQSPRKIEVFDNSNIQGSDAVAAMVTFIDGKPSRKNYRKFTIKEVSGPDDYGSMREIIRRRYVRLLKEKADMPDLIVVDGGKGQISAALDVLHNELNLELPVCGLAKDDRHRTSQLFMGEDPDPVPIDRAGQAFYLLQRMQDEVHRFAITFHRQTRSKHSMRSRLHDIPGVGEKRQRSLLKHFGSIERMKEASIEEFRKIGIGEKLAKDIVAYLQQG